MDMDVLYVQEWIRLLSHEQGAGPILLSARMGPETFSLSFGPMAGHNGLLGIFFPLNSSFYCFYSCLIWCML